MPTIILPERKKKLRHKDVNKNDRVHKLVYCKRDWRELRLDYLREHPICEKCGRKLATEVHHIIHLSGLNDAEIVKKGFDPTNLMALCIDCHRDIHNHIGDNEGVKKFVL